MSGEYVFVGVQGVSRPEHIVIAETALGRRLPSKACVHHVDGQKRHNARSNLVICQDQSYHMLLHSRARVVKAGGDPDTQRLCSQCKTCKPFSAFYFVAGRQRRCKACEDEYDAGRSRPPVTPEAIERQRIRTLIWQRKNLSNRKIPWKPRCWRVADGVRSTLHQPGHVCLKCGFGQKWEDKGGGGL